MTAYEAVERIQTLERYVELLELMKEYTQFEEYEDALLEMIKEFESEKNGLINRLHEVMI